MLKIISYLFSGKHTQKKKSGLNKSIPVYIWKCNNYIVIQTLIKLTKFVCNNNRTHCHHICVQFEISRKNNNLYNWCSFAIPNMISIISV